MYPEDQIRPYAEDLHAAVRSGDDESVKAVGRELHEAGGMDAMHQTHRLYAKLYGKVRGGNPRLVDMLWNGIGQWMG